MQIAKLSPAILYITGPPTRPTGVVLNKLEQKNVTWKLKLTKLEEISGKQIVSINGYRTGLLDITNEFRMNFYPLFTQIKIFFCQLENNTHGWSIIAYKTVILDATLDGCPFFFPSSFLSFYLAQNKILGIAR